MGRLSFWRLVLASDLLACVLGAALAGAPWSYALSSAVLVPASFALSDLYRPRLHLSVVDDLPALLGRGAIASVVATAFQRHLPDAPLLGGAVQQCLATLLAVVLLRCLAYTSIRQARASGVVSHRTLVLGAGLVGARIAGTLLTTRSYGLLPVGVLDDEPFMAGHPLALPHLGGIADLDRVCEQEQISVLIIAFARQPESDLVGVLRRSERVGREIFIVPRLYEVQAAGYRDHIGAVPVTRVNRKRLRRFSWAVKRTLDVLVSAGALLVLAPLLLVIALGVRIDGGPGVIFRQIRVGRDGREFELLKFRSLAPQDEGESATRWSVASDSRIGKVGALLRRTSFDELPQLWNILRGDMSLVGPRPERPHFVQVFGEQHPTYTHRHRVPCGLTGLSQVSGFRGDTSIQERAMYDNYYIENWSLWLDVKILCSTVREVVTAAGR